MQKKSCSLVGILLVVFLSQVGCGVEFRDKDEKAKSAVVEAPDSETAPDRASITSESWIPMSGPHFVIDEGVMPGAYRVRMQLPPDTVFVDRSLRGAADKKRIWVKDTVFIDEDVQSGESYDYRFFKSPTEKSGETLVQVPFDLFVEKTLMFSDLKLGRPIRRMYMGPAAVLETGSTNFDLRIETLIAEPGAVIRTFPPDARASDPAQTVSGGQMRITLLKAVGALKVELRGMNGADGLPGKTYPQRAKDGDPVQPKEAFQTCDGMQAGHNGADGANGGAGGKAGNGGSTGSLEIEVKSNHDLKVHVIFEPGKAGRPGPGGEGQSAGLGSAPEQRSYTQTYMGPDMHNMKEKIVCPTPPPGQPGKPGQRGPKGAEGIAGSKGLYCLKVDGVCR